MPTDTSKFIVGKSYTARSACDSNCMFKMRIVSRTDKTAMVQHDDVVRRYKIHKRPWNQCESISMGSYSMAPSWYAKDMLR